MGRSRNNVVTETSNTRVVVRELTPADDAIRDKFNKTASLTPDDSPGLVWFGAFADGEMVALASVNRRSAGSVALLASCVVRRAWRGRGLQAKLISARVRWAVANGVERLISYVRPTRPDGTQSLRNLVRAGFLPRKLPAVERRLSGADYRFPGFIWVEWSKN
jgi:GNAT superfamily N-acetyltransferase